MSAPSLPPNQVGTYAPPPVVIPTLTVVEAFLNWLRSMVGVRERGENDGEFVRWFQAATGNEPPAAWCLSFLIRGLVASLGGRCRILRTGGCVQLATWAKAKKIVVTEPEPGDIVLVWYPSKGRVAHAYAVETVLPDGRVETIEGNTSDPDADPTSPQAREGWCVARRRGDRARRIQPGDVIVRWRLLVS